MALPARSESVVPAVDASTAMKKTDENEEGEQAAKHLWVWCLSVTRISTGVDQGAGPAKTKKRKTKKQDSEGRSEDILEATTFDGEIGIAQKIHNYGQCSVFPDQHSLTHYTDVATLIALGQAKLLEMNAAAGYTTKKRVVESLAKEMKQKVSH